MCCLEYLKDRKGALLEAGGAKRAIEGSALPEEHPLSRRLDAAESAVREGVRSTAGFHAHLYGKHTALSTSRMASHAEGGAEGGVGARSGATGDTEHAVGSGGDGSDEESTRHRRRKLSRIERDALFARITMPVEPRTAKISDMTEELPLTDLLGRPIVRVHDPSSRSRVHPTPPDGILPQLQASRGAAAAARLAGGSGGTNERMRSSASLPAIGTFHTAKASRGRSRAPAPSKAVARSDSTQTFTMRQRQAVCTPPTTDRSAALDQTLAQAMTTISPDTLVLLVRVQAMARGRFSRRRAPQARAAAEMEARLDLVLSAWVRRRRVYQKIERVMEQHVAEKAKAAARVDGFSTYMTWPVSASPFVSYATWDGAGGGTAAPPHTPSQALDEETKIEAFDDEAETTSGREGLDGSGSALLQQIETYVEANAEARYGRRVLDIMRKRTGDQRPMPTLVRGYRQMRGRSVRVFLSSTFRDMNDERAVFLKRFAPSLRQQAVERGVFLTFVDLRWGVTVGQAQGGEVVNICLDQLAQSKYFVNFLGLRYGWRPAKEDLTNETFDRFGHVLNSYCPGRSVTEFELIYGVRRQTYLWTHRSHLSSSHA